MFDEPGDPSPLTEDVALLRAEKCVEPIARFFTYGAMTIALPAMIINGFPLWLAATSIGLIWYVAWVLVFRRWRIWAIAGGCDPEELEYLGEESGILAARGSWLWYIQWPAHSP